MLARIDAAAARASAAEPAGKPLSRNAWIVRAVEAQLPDTERPHAEIPEPDQARSPKTEYVAKGRRVGSRWMWEVPGGWPGATAPMSGPVPFKGDVAMAATEAIARQLGHRNFTLKVEWS
jgi:hypothetical protein